MNKELDEKARMMESIRERIEIIKEAVNNEADYNNIWSMLQGIHMDIS